MNVRTQPFGRRWVLTLSLLAALPAGARPYRAMVTRTAETVKPGRLELGLRYQGFHAGRGRLGVNPFPYQQLALSARWGIVRGLEANTELEMLAVDPLGSPAFRPYFGDIPLGLQWTFVSTPAFALGVWARVTVPTGPSQFDGVPPTLSDGTLDAEGTLLVELRPTRQFRLMLNGGFMHHGVRPNSVRIANFDVPEAIRADVAMTLNLGPRALIGLELLWREFLRNRVTPVWEDNPRLVEILPLLRLETSPGLVLEGALGFSLTRDLQEMYLVRALLGLTYEF